MEQLVLQYAGLPVPELIDIDNRGISSQTSFEIAARSPSSFVVDYAPAGYRTEYLIINGGKNDNRSTTTPAQTYANLASISVAAQALGVISVMTTAFYGTPAAMTPQDYIWVDQLNALIRANSCGANYVVDYYIDPILANPTSAHWPDDVHPDNVGLAAMANCVRGILG